MKDSIPKDGKIQRFLNAVVVICLVIWLVAAFGIITQENGIHLSRVH